MLASSVAVRNRLRNDTNIRDLGLTQRVDHSRKYSERNRFIGAKEHRLLRFFELGSKSRSEAINVHWIIPDVNPLAFINGDHQLLFRNLFGCSGLGEVDFDAGLEDGGGDHEDDEEDEDDVNERHHVDVGEGALRVAGELRHG